MAGQIKIMELKPSGGVLHSHEEWLQIHRLFKKEYGRCETNCYLTQQKIEAYIGQQRLFYEISNDTLWLYEQERGYAVGYYFVPKNRKLMATRQLQDVVIYLIGTEKRYMARKREEELRADGCKIYRNNLEYSVPADRLSDLQKQEEGCGHFLKKMGMHYAVFRAYDYEEVFQMWRGRIGPYSVKDALPGQIQRWEQNAECIEVRTVDGRIAAACCFELNGISGHSENIAVKKDFNGSGIGAALLCHSFLKMAEAGADISVYVWEKNLASRKICGRFASLTGRFSRQLLLEKNKTEAYRICNQMY